MTLLCEFCRSSDVEKRGTREKDGEIYHRVKCRSCSKWSRGKIEYEETKEFKRTEEELAKLLEADTYIIMCAQNNTGVDKIFWAGLKQYAKYKKAQIMVLPIVFPRRVNVPDDFWWAPEIEPYLMNQDITLVEGLRVVGDSFLSLTAVNPLTGFDSLTQSDSAILGHPQIQMKTVATPQNRLPKILHTTGAVTQKNYKPSGAGKKGDFHHSLGAVIVEIDKEEGVFHLRSLVGDSKSEFYDVDKHITSRGVKQSKGCEAIVLGDEHVITNCEDVYNATFVGNDSIVQTCRPKFIVRHDVIDSYSISHHHRQTPSIRLGKHMAGTDKLREELEDTARFVEGSTPDFSQSVIVPSNHHDHIKKWLEEVDWKMELWNARIYHEMWAAWIAAIELNRGFHPFTWWMKQNCKANVIYLEDDYPFIVKDIYLGYHGDRGSNGSKGSIKAFAKMGCKTVTGHTHTPGIEKGAYAVGTSTRLKLEYTSGPSSWMNTHCLIHPNGKRQLINILWGDWRYDA